MKKEQKEQKEQNQNLEELNPYDKLDEFGQQIVDLRLEGWKYKRLELIAKKKEGTIRKWFMFGGQYHAAYYFRRDQLIKEALEDFVEAEFHLKQGIADAIVVLKAEIVKKNWKAAVALLKMVGFNVQKIISEGESEGTLLLREIIKSRRNEKQRRSGKTVQNRKSENKPLTQSEENI